MTFKNPDNPKNIRTIDAFDVVGFSGDATEDIIYMNFISNDPRDPSQGIVEGSLVVRDFNQLKGLRDMVVRAVEDIDKKIGQ